MAFALVRMPHFLAATKAILILLECNYCFLPPSAVFGACATLRMIAPLFW